MSQHDLLSTLLEHVILYPSSFLIHQRLKSGGRVFVFMVHLSPFGAMIFYPKFRKKMSDLYREFRTIFTPIRFILSIITAERIFRLSCLTPH